MWYGERGTGKFLETLADNVFRQNYFIMQIKKNELWESVGVTQAYTLKARFQFSLKYSSQ